MTPAITTIVAIAAFAAVACAQKEPPVATGDCGSGVCKLDVTVANNDCSSANNIKVSREVLEVKKNNPNKIEWTIKTEGFTWVAAPNGITGLPPAIFENPQDNGKKYEIHDKNPEQTPTDHKYAIQLKGPNGPCAVLDPVIRNGA